MSKGVNVLVGIKVDNSDFVKGLKQSSEQIQGFKKSGNSAIGVLGNFKKIGGGVVGTLGKFAGVAGLAVGGIETFTTAMNSNRETQVKFQAAMLTARTSVKNFFVALTSGNWDTFANGISNAVTKTYQLNQQLVLLPVALKIAQGKITRLDALREQAEAILMDPDASAYAKGRAMKDYIKYSNAETSQINSTNKAIKKTLDQQLSVWGVSIKYTGKILEYIDNYGSSENFSPKLVKALQWKKEQDRIESELRDAKNNLKYTSKPGPFALKGEIEAYKAKEDRVKALEELKKSHYNTEYDIGMKIRPYLTLSKDDLDEGLLNAEGILELLNTYWSNEYMKGTVHKDLIGAKDEYNKIGEGFADEEDTTPKVDDTNPLLAEAVKIKNELKSNYAKIKSDVDDGIIETTTEGAKKSADMYDRLTTSVGIFSSTYDKISKKKVISEEDIELLTEQAGIINNNLIPGLRDLDKYYDLKNTPDDIKTIAMLTEEMKYLDEEINNAPADKLLELLNRRTTVANRISDLSSGAAFAPEGSLIQLYKRMDELRKKQQNAVSNDEYQFYDNLIQEVQDKIDGITGVNIEIEPYISDNESELNRLYRERADLIDKLNKTKDPNKRIILEAEIQKKEKETEKKEGEEEAKKFITGYSNMIGNADFKSKEGRKAVANETIESIKALIMAEAIEAAIKLGFPAFLVAAPAAAALVNGLFTMIPRFSTGGIFGGNSTVGDYNIARVNSGEMILNNRQQRNLFNLLNSGGTSEHVSNSQVEFKIQGKELVGVLNNYGNKMRKI